MLHEGRKMTDDLVKRLRSTAKAGSLLPPYPEVINAAADRIEELEKALQSILKVPDSESAYHVIRVFARDALE
jgi:hypothetical protein